MREKQQNPLRDSFLIPDLCTGRPLVLLLMATQLLVILFMLFQFGLEFDWIYMGSVTVYMQWQAIGSALLMALVREYFLLLPKNQAASATFALLVLWGALMAVVAQWLDHPDRLTLIDWPLVARNTLISAIVVGIALRYLYVQQQLVDREKSELQASLSALQARIKPHFLFNTMNSIASLISIAPEKAEKMIEDLAELLRASLREEMLETTIANEWELCQRYLEIEQLRLGERLSWQCDFSALNEALPIPSLSLQPIVENAIYHGIQASPHPGFIRVSGHLQEGRVVIQVENSFDRAYKSERPNKGNKMAINNIRHRLQHLYGDSASLELEEKNGSFLVTLSYKPGEK